MAKISREKAKIDFLKSKYHTCSEWGKNYFVDNNLKQPHKDHINKMTRGRSNEKKILLELATDKAQKDVINETIEDIKKIYKPSEDELGEMHKALMNIIKGGINQLGQEAKKKDKDGNHTGNIDTKRVKDLWEIVKGEKGEPTRHTKLDTSEGSGAAVIIVAPSVGGIMDEM